MNVLVIGSGGREHALVWKLAQSPLAEKIYCAPGNAGTAQSSENVSLSDNDIPGLLKFAQENNVGLTVVGPEVPLVEGIVDSFEEAGLRIFGPNKRAAILEGSKVFTKELLIKHNIPTATYYRFKTLESAMVYLKGIMNYPIVIKADGLAAGKGVLILENSIEAEAGIQMIMEDRVFGDAGNEIIVEEFLSGPELSMLCFVDANTVVPMVSAKDYKRIGEGDSGLNTGGMGAISPNPLYDQELEDFCLNEVIQPTLDGMKADGRPFKGILYCGLMLTEDGPKVLEYNVRFGDPETQVILPRLKTDLVEIFEAIIDDRLGDINVEWDSDVAATVVLASEGYPQSYTKGLPITGLGNVEDSTVFHAGTKIDGDRILTSGGRVLAVTSCGSGVDEALAKSYASIQNIEFKGKTIRRDIGT